MTRLTIPLTRLEMGRKLLELVEEKFPGPLPPCSRIQVHYSEILVGHEDLQRPQDHQTFWDEHGCTFTFEILDRQDLRTDSNSPTPANAGTFEVIIEAPLHEQKLSRRGLAVLANSLTREARAVPRIAAAQLGLHGIFGRAQTSVAFRHGDLEHMIGSWAKELVDAKCPEDCLDEIVHTTASTTASSVNNGGIEAQLRYLAEELGKTEVCQIISRLSTSNPPDE